MLLKKGGEELLPEELYLLSKTGVWTEEKKDGTVLVHFYPEDGDVFLGALEGSRFPVLEVHREQEELKDYSALTQKVFSPYQDRGPYRSPAVEQKEAGRTVHCKSSPGWPSAQGGTNRRDS